MTPVARLVAASVVTLVGAGLAVFGATTTWYTVSQKGITVDVPDFGSVPFGDERFVARGGDLAPALPGIVVLVLLASLLVLLAGRRARVALLAGALGLSALAIVFASVVGPSDARTVACRSNGRFLCGRHGLDIRIASGPGRWLTIAGAGIVIVGAAVAIPVATKVKTLRMPERA